MQRSNLIAIVAFALLGACAGQPTSQDVTEMSGKDLYGQRCASCHGVHGKGDGPMAPLLKIDVPDLTGIAARHGGQFPADQVRRTIDGRFQRPAHGLPYMPVWGLKFSDAGNTQSGAEQGSRMIERLVDHLRSIQLAAP